jgi:hypothetical protein
MIEPGQLRAAQKADLRYIRGDLEAAGRWLDEECQHPYFFVSVERGVVFEWRTARVEGDAGVSCLWTPMLPTSVDLTLRRPIGNIDWLRIYERWFRFARYFVVFDDRRDLLKFKKLFRKPAQPV